MAFQQRYLVHTLLLLWPHTLSHPHTPHTLSQELGITRTTLSRRIDALFEEGVIQKISAKIDFAKIGLPLLSFLLVTFRPGKQSQREVAKKIASIPNVMSVYIISGTWDILVLARTASMKTTSKLILDQIREIEGVGTTMTCFVMETIKETVDENLEFLLTHMEE